MTAPPPVPDTEDRTGDFPVGAEVPPLAARGLERLTIPSQRTLLAGMLVLRLVLLVLAVDRSNTSLDIALVSGLVVIVLVATLWLASRLRRPAEVPGPNALLLQALIDILVVTGVVRLFGPGTATSVAALYIAVVTVYALVLPLGHGLLAVALATGSYVGVRVVSTGILPAATVTFWTQVVVIAFIGGLIALLGNRLTGASREQRALAAALAQARLEADEILASIQSGVITVDGDGRLGYLNPRGRLILGGGRTTFVPGQPVLETLRARSRELHDAIVRGITDGTRVSRGEAAVRRGDGSLFPVGLSTTTFNRPGSDRRLVTAIFTDISDLKRLQEFRLRAERLEAVAALSASLAHEIRNPLAAIRSAVEQLSRSVGQDEDDQTLARLVMRESERLNRLLNEFLDFSRVRATNLEKIDLMALVRDAVRIASEHPAAQGATLTVEGEPVEMEADEDLIHRVVSNLVLNAAQALGGQGTITITVGRAEVSERPGGPVDRTVKLIVQDNGPGIPESIRDRLFEPFVTGRPGGTGLGLAIVQRAVSAHRGVILVDTGSNGTTFSIFLPATWNREDRA